MRTNKEGQDIIKRYESLQLKAYICPAGVPTIGCGHTKGITKEMVQNGYTISEKIAMEMFLEDLSYFERAIIPMIIVPVNQNQFSAMVSLAYNIGQGSEKSKPRGFYWSDVRKFVNLGDFESAKQAFMRHVYAGGKILKGLENRRKSEMELFSREFIPQP